MAKNGKERKLDKRLIQVYEQRGLDMFLNVCAEMLNIKDREDWEKKKKVNGEVCELVLRIMTEDYLKRKGLKGYVFHSLVLKNLRNPKSDFRTELDFTLLTPGFCVTGECKSFSGQILVTDECTLRRGDLVADVGRQSQVHMNALVPYLQECVREGAGVSSPPVGKFCFLYSNGGLADRRNSTAQASLPVLTIKTLFSYYEGLFRRYGREVYDVEKAAKKFQAMADSRILHIQHAHYVGY